MKEFQWQEGKQPRIDWFQVAAAICILVFVLAIGGCMIRSATMDYECIPEYEADGEC